VIEVSPSDQSSPLFSLLNGEGAGSMLAAAAGDVAGGLSPVGYSCPTQQATVLAYHLLRHDRIDRPGLIEDWLELAADGEAPSLYRGASDQFESFLEAARVGEAAAVAEPSAEPATRVHPVGVWFRRQPDLLVEAGILASRLTHSDATSVLAAVVVAGAVAASCYAQAGRDLLHAAAEVGERCMAAIGDDDVQFSRLEEARSWQRTLAELALYRGSWDGVMQAIRVRVATGSQRDLPLLAILIAAPPEAEPYRQIERAASAGGSPLAVMTGALVGARVGIRSWPWVVPNDTWFAEIGRRLVSGNRETRDIPVPNHVEERLSLGGNGPLI
jgi:ADP-ribosylglycohydrolase